MPYFVGLGCGMLSRRPILSLGHSVGHLGAMGGPYKVVSYSFTPNCPMWYLNDFTETLAGFPYSLWALSGQSEGLGCLPHSVGP